LLLTLTSGDVARLRRTETRIADRPLISVEIDEIAHQILALLNTAIESGWISAILYRQLMQTHLSRFDS
jgi:hypothetical protein